MIEIAVMVEPRLHLYLKPVIDNMLRNLTENIPIQIFHSSLNENFLNENYRELIDNPKTTILSKIGTDIKEGINIFHKYDTTDPIYKKFS